MTFHPRLIELNRELQRMVVPSLLRCSVLPEDKGKWVVAFHTGKACKTHEAILILAERGYGQDAGVLVRSMLNLTINLLWIRKDASRRTEMYLDYHWLVRQGLAKVVKQRPPLLGIKGRPTAEELENDIRALDSQVSKVKQDHKYNRFGWSKLPIAQMAAEVGLQDHYNYAYRILSNIEHTNSSSTIAYLTQTPEGFRINVGPGEQYIREVLATAYDLLLLIFQEADKVLGLGLTMQLDQAREKRADFLKPQAQY